MKTTRVLWLIPLLLLGLTLLMAQPGWAQDAQPALSILQVDDSQYPQMKVLVTVADANGIPIQGLDKNAFLVTEDGRAAPIQQVAAVQGAAPLNLVLAIDVSGSMKGQPIDTTRQAVAQLLGNLSPQDKAGLLIFNQKVRELAPLGSDPNTLLAAVQSLQADGDTALYDAIHEAVMRVKNAPVGRRAVVVFSDGKDTRSGLTLEDAISTAQRFAVPVYVVGYGPKIQPKQLQRIAQLTGGAFFRAPKLEDIPTAFAQVMNALNQAYEITYLGVTPVDDGEHELRVILTLAGQSVEESAPFVARAGNIALQLNLGQLPDRTDAEAVWRLMDMPPLDAQIPLLSGDILLDPQTQPGKPTRATILLDDQPLASDIQPPYTWDTSSVEPGQHTLSLQVWDHVGNEASVEQPVAVVPIAFAKLVQPAASIEITGVVPVQWDIATIVPLAEVIVTHQDVELARFSGPPYQFDWNVTTIPSGKTQLDLTLAFQDGESMTYSFPVTIGEHVHATIISPSGGAELKGKVTLRADVVSDVRVEEATFYVGDTPVAKVNTPPYQAQIHTGDYPPGQYTIRVTARNLAGMEAKDSVQVTMVPVTRTNALGLALILAAIVLIIIPVIFFARKRRQPSEPIPPAASEPEAASSPAAMPLGWLTRIRGETDQSRYPIYPGETRLGRNRQFADIAIPDLSVSRRHAIIHAGVDGIYLEDLNPNNPTHINDQPNPGRTLIQPGDRIRLGETEFLFESPTPSSSQP